MIKIVYFDEGSATDLLYVLAGGKNTDKKEQIVTKTSDLVKMKMDYHAIEVGTVNMGNLTMESEFGDNGEREINGYDLASSNGATIQMGLQTFLLSISGTDNRLCLTL